MHLAKKEMRVTDLQTDLCDGVKLITLLEILNDTKIEGRYYRNPKSKPYKIDNVNFALSFITDTLKITLISCSAEGTLPAPPGVSFSLPLLRHRRREREDYSGYALASHSTL